jgi:hypothetical protein
MTSLSILEAWQKVLEQRAPSFITVVDHQERPLHKLVSLFGMRFLTHQRAHLLNRKNSA